MNHSINSGRVSLTSRKRRGSNGAGNTHPNGRLRPTHSIGAWRADRDDHEDRRTAAVRLGLPSRREPRSYGAGAESSYSAPSFLGPVARSGLVAQLWACRSAVPGAGAPRRHKETEPCQSPLPHDHCVQIAQEYGVREVVSSEGACSRGPCMPLSKIDWERTFHDERERPRPSFASSPRAPGRGSSMPCTSRAR